MDIVPLQEFSRRYRRGQLVMVAPLLIRLLAIAAAADLALFGMLSACLVVITVLWWEFGQRGVSFAHDNIESLFSLEKAAVRRHVVGGYAKDGLWLALLYCAAAFILVAIDPSPAKIAGVLLFLPILASGPALRWFVFEGWVLGVVESSTDFSLER